MVPYSTWLVEGLSVVQLIVAVVLCTLLAATAENCGGFVTVTVTSLPMPTFPAASLACAFRVCVPFAVFVLSQAMLYGSVVSGEPSGAPSRRNWTLVTPTLSEADAETVKALPDTTVPLVGAVSDTVGAVVSATAPV